MSLSFVETPEVDPRSQEKLNFTDQVEPDQETIPMTAEGAEDQTNRLMFAATKAGTNISTPQDVAVQNETRLEVLRELRLGRGNLLRQEIARTKTLEVQNERLGLIKDISSGLGEDSGPISFERQQAILNLSNEEIVDPNIVFEKLFAETAVDAAVLTNDHMLDKALQEDPNATLDVISDEIQWWTRANTVRNAYDKVESAIANAGVIERVIDFSKGFLPFYDAIKMMDVLKEAPNTSYLPGNNLFEAIAYLWTLRPETFAKELNLAVDELLKTNLFSARQFVDAAHGYSQFESSLDNMWLGLDIADVATIGAVSTLRGALRRTRHGVNSLRTFTGAGGAAAVGATNAAAAGRAFDAVKKSVEGTVNERIIALTESTTSLGDPSRVTRGTSNLSANETAEIVNVLTENNNQLLRVVFNVNSIDRLDEKSLAAAVEFAQNTLKARYKDFDDSILDIDTLLDKELDTITLYRGTANPSNAVSKDTPQWVRDSPDFQATEKATGRWWTDSKDEAQWYIDNVNKGGTIEKIEVPRAEAEALRVSNLKAKVAGSTDDPKKFSRRPELEFFLPHKMINEGRARLRNAIARSEDSVANVDTIAIRFGRPDKSLFDSEETALMFAKDTMKLLDDSYKVKQDGLGYFIQVEKDIDETIDTVREALIVSTNAKTPQSFINTFFAPLRTADDLLSVENRVARSAVTHASQEIINLVKPTVDRISKISKRKKRDLEKLMRIHARQKHEVHPWPGSQATEERIGKYSETIQELEQEYLTNFNRLPDVDEVNAYFSVVQLNDLDFVVRNLGIYRDKSRQGVENFVIDTPVGELADAIPKTKFEGRQHLSLPTTIKETSGIWYFDDALDTGTFYLWRDVPQELRQRMEFNLAQRSHGLIQVANPLEAGAKMVDGQRVNYVMTPNYKASRLDFQQIPYRGGGHSEVKFGFFLKQPRISRLDGGLSGTTRHAYEGDTTLFGFGTKAEAEKWLPSINEGIRIAREKGLDSVDLDIFVRNNFGARWTTKDFKAFFQSGKLSLDEKVFITEQGRNVGSMKEYGLDRQYDNFENLVEDPANLFQDVNKKYASERSGDLPTIADGSETRPLGALEETRFVDPFTTLNHSTANMMRDRLMADYKFKHIENFIQEFHDVMKVPLEELRQNPMLYVYEPVWDDLTKNRPKLAAAKASRRAMMHLLGTQSDLSRGIDWLQNKIIDQVFKKGGKKRSDFVQDHLLPSTRDPFKFMRSVAFHSKLGLFNPVQLFLQGQTFAHAFALAPRHAPGGTHAAILMRWGKVNQTREVTEHLAETAARYGSMSKDDYLESYDNLRKTGLWNVEGEVSFRDDAFDAPVFKGKLGSFLDKGTFFFREGERFNRLVSWNTAFKEWRAANPGKKMNRADRGEVLLRAKDMTVNMTRDSNAAWQKGFLAVPTQFFSFQARLLDQVWGNRLTLPEKGRLIAIHSMLYGLPIGLSASTGAPVADDIKQALLQNGIEYDDGVLEALIEGLPAKALEAILGEQHAVGTRYGSGGFQVIDDFFTGDADALDILGGASVSILRDIIKTTAPAVIALTDWMNTSDDTKYPMLLEDFLDAAANISSVNQATRAYYLYTTQQYISRNQVNFGEAGWEDALMYGFLGVQPRDIEKTGLMIESISTQKQAKDNAEIQATKNIRRMIKSDSQEDQLKFRRAARVHLIIGGYTPKEVQQVYSRAVRGMTDIRPSIEAAFRDKYDLPNKLEQQLNRGQQ